jgi:hypothetical protein
MEKKNNHQSANGRHEHPLPHEISTEQKEKNRSAHDEALGDIEKDDDLSTHSPNDDLDESESARLGEDRTDLV